MLQLPRSSWTTLLGSTRSTASCCLPQTFEESRKFTAAVDEFLLEDVDACMDGRKRCVAFNRHLLSL